MDARVRVRRFANAFAAALLVSVAARPCLGQSRVAGAFPGGMPFPRDSRASFGRTHSRLDPAPHVAADASAPHRRRNIIIGAVLGGVAGAVLGNAYARAHLPPCLPTPAGFCIRSGDHTTLYKATGILGGVLLGGWLGAAARSLVEDQHLDHAP
jgi:hypothetical protein